MVSTIAFIAHTCKSQSRTTDIWVVDLDVPQAMVIEDLQFLLEYRDDIGKILVIRLVNVLRIGLSFLVAEMIPCWCRDSELDAVVLFLWQNPLKILHLFDVCLGCCRVILNSTRADYCLARLVIFLIIGQSGYFCLSSFVFPFLGKVLNCMDIVQRLLPTTTGI